MEIKLLFKIYKWSIYDAYYTHLDCQFCQLLQKAKLLRKYKPSRALDLPDSRKLYDYSRPEYS